MIITGFISPEQLEKLVQKELEKRGITINSYPFDVDMLVRNEGILLFEQRFNSPSIKGMLSYNIDHGKSAILVNEARTGYSQRFAIMHEFCHYLFHPKKKKIVCDDYFNQNDAQEWQANNAAAYALVPTCLLKSKYEEYGGSMNKLCNFFEVGESCMTYRLQSLGLPIIKDCLDKNNIDLRESIDIQDSKLNFILFDHQVNLDEESLASSNITEKESITIDCDVDKKTGHDFLLDRLIKSLCSESLYKKKQLTFDDFFKNQHKSS